MRLGDYIQVQTRIRYTYWNLLGDVGGFHDGFGILISICMGSYGALAFKAEYLSGNYIDNGG